MRANMIICKEIRKPAQQAVTAFVMTTWPPGRI
jgi:hypothetical protein